MVLFKGRYLAGGEYEVNYDVSPDGARFLMIKPLERPGSQPVVVVLNWFEELKRKAGK